MTQDDTFPRSIVFNKKHHWQKNVMKLQPLMINYCRWQFNGFKHFLEFSPRNPGKWSNLTTAHIFQMDQLESHQVLGQLFFFETGAPTPWVRTLTLILTMPSTTCLVMTDVFFSAKCREAAGNTPLLNEKETKNTHKHPADRCGGNVLW